MSEKIYALLLRLYPTRFRAEYGDEALQLFRDRARDERGFFPTLRLWLDLLADLAISVPSEYFHAQPAFIVSPVRQHLDGTPSFFLLENESPRLGALLFGSVLSLLAIATVSVLNGHGASYRPLGALAAQSQYANAAPSSAVGRLAPQRSADSEQKILASRQPTTAANALIEGDAEPGSSQSSFLLILRRFGLVKPQALQPRPQSVARAMVESATVDPAERRRVIDGAIANLKQHYVDPDVARKTADALLAHEKSGDDDTATNRPAFAYLLTRQIRDVSHDMHLEVINSQVALPEHPREPTPEDLARYRKAMEQQHCMFEKVEVLPHNIGYLKLNFFADTSVCLAAATAAMASLNHVDAVIFDLRDNMGGFPNMVSLISGYLFDHPEYMYNPREAPTLQSWTPSPVPGNRLADKPVYVLTSARTISGAEEFCYDLKMLKRATLVGETTRGSAHAGVFHRIDDHFGMGIPEVRAINPYAKTDWEGTGVDPDVKVKAADALETAVKLAQTKLRKN
jgi:hypothetical protein